MKHRILACVSRKATHSRGHLVTFLALLALLAATAPAQTAVASTPTLGSELVRNGGFETNLDGWKANNSTTHLTRVAGRTDAGAVSLSADARANVVLNDATATVASTQPGTPYAVSAWVRSVGGPANGQLRVREVRGTSVAQYRTSIALTDSAWHKVSLDFTTVSTGSSLDLNVMAWSLATGTAFEVDDVSMVMTQDSSTSTTGVLSNGCAYSARGLPSCGAYFGAAYGANDDPTPFERQVHRNLGVHRTFFGPSQVSSAVNTAQTDLAAGRLPWISFKLPYSWSDMAIGKGDAWAKNIATRMAELNGPVWIAFHHEPEGDGNIALWTAIQKRLSPIVRNAAPNVAYTIVVTGWNQLYGPSRYSFDAIWPGDGLVDVIGVDVYLSYGVTKDGRTTTKFTDVDAAYFKPISAWAKSHGTHWGLAESGYTDAAVVDHPTWLHDSYTQLMNRNGVAFSYFNTTLNSAASWPVTSEAKKAAFAAVLKTSASLPPLR